MTATGRLQTAALFATRDLAWNVPVVGGGASRQVSVVLGFRLRYSG